MSQAPIEYQRFGRGESCTEEGCRARKFYIEDGKKFCQRGHEQAGFTLTQQDDDDFGTQGKTTRKKKAEEEKVITTLSGNDAKELYLQCLQLVIWKQCHWLVKTKRLPAELETVVRDLWGLRVGVVWKDRDQNQSAFSSQVFSSQSEGEPSGTEEPDGKSLSSKRSRVLEEKLPKLRETLGLCYLGMLLMRLPVSLGEVWEWASRDEITFMRAIKEIPKEMRRKLPPYFHSALELKAPLKGYTLHRTVGDLVIFFNRHFDMDFPQLNTHLLLYKHIQQLSLPVEIYLGVQRLAPLLSITFSFPTAISTSRYQTTSYPEIHLIALIIIATKFLHPFDNVQRVPESDSDPTSTRINWKEWTKIMIQPPNRDLKRGDEIHVQEMDVWDMDGQQMDDYMNWYQRSWIDDRPPKLAEQILNMFPLDELPPEQEIESDSEKRMYRIKAAQHNLEIQKSWPMEGDGQEERIHRPGDFYKRYRSLEELPEFAKGFFELAAKITGTSVNLLVKAVFRLEAKLEKWRLTESKKDLFRQQGENINEEQEDDNDESEEDD